MQEHGQVGGVVDTHVWLWILTAPRRLALPEPPDRYVPKRIHESGVEPLPLEHAHELRVSVLELHHRDPFDRLLIAQAQVERVPLLTADRVFGLYDVEVIPAV